MSNKVQNTLVLGASMTELQAPPEARTFQCRIDLFPCSRRATPGACCGFIHCPQENILPRGIIILILLNFIESEHVSYTADHTNAH